jgi:hypothetical protein
MSIATDVRAYADAAIEQGKTVVTQASAAVASANKRIVDDLPTLRVGSVSAPAYAAVGAADLVAETVSKRVESLPTDAASNLAKVQETSKARVSKASEGALAKVVDLRERFDARVESAKSLRNVDVQAAAKGVSENYLESAKSVYSTLTARGHAKVDELIKSPRLGKLRGDFTGAASTVQAAVAPVVGEVSTRIAPVVGEVSTRIAPVVNEVTSRVGGRPGAKKASATKAASKKAPAPKAPATKAAAKKAPAKKAAPSTPSSE